MFNTFFSENHTVYEVISKQVVDTEGPQMTSQYGAHALRAGLARLHALGACTRPRARVPTCTHARTQTHARRPISNTYCFSTATMVSRTRLIVTLYVHCLYCFPPHSSRSHSPLPHLPSRSTPPPPPPSVDPCHVAVVTFDMKSLCHGPWFVSSPKENRTHKAACLAQNFVSCR